MVNKQKDQRVSKEASQKIAKEKRKTEATPPSGTHVLRCMNYKGNIPQNILVGVWGATKEDPTFGEFLSRIFLPNPLKKKPSPGWEFEKGHALRAAKFHVHAKGAGGSELVWAVCCVYDSNFSELLARGFLEKLLFLTEPLRDTPQWQSGGTLAAQDSFAPTLMQRMEQANSMGKTAMVSQKVDEVKAIMHDNIDLLLERGQKLEDLDEKATALGKASKAFHKGARTAKRFQLWQQAKFGVVVGTAVTVGVAAIVAPVVVAAL